MKTAYITIQFPVPSETFATNEVRTLQKCGISVVVHGLRPPHAARDALLRERGIASVPVTHNSVGASLRGALAAVRRPLLLLRTLAWIVRHARGKTRDLIDSLLLLPRAFDILAHIETDRPHVVHMYWRHFPTLVGFLVQRRCPSIVTSMSIVAYDLRREYGGAVQVARDADVLRTHARANVAHVARFTGVDPERINVIYNGVDIEWLEEATHDITKIPRRLVTTGRLIPEKGMDEVLEAFREVRARWPDATLVVAGDGPDRGRLQSICASLGITDGVQFLGHVTHERVVEEMAKAEAFVLLSRYGGERLPNVVKEAMACRCICITTPTPGIEELVESGVTGFVVPPGASGEVAGVIDRLFEGSIDVSGIARRAVAHIRHHFDLHETAPRYAALWRAALEARATDARPMDGHGHAEAAIDAHPPA